MTEPAKTAAHPLAPGSARGRGAVAAPVREFLAFRLGEEDYAIDILKVQEIRVLEAVTRLPGTPDYVKGVINLRGLIAPVIDLRVKFGFEQAEYGPFTVLIVLHVRDRLVAVVVDAVADVVGLTEDEIKPAPEFATGVNIEYITGLGARGERMLILLDIERLVSSPELGIFDDEGPA
jgi:purine-binding chemotaxis protein CheW